MSSGAWEARPVAYHGIADVGNNWRVKLFALGADDAPDQSQTRTLANRFCSVLSGPPKLSEEFEHHFRGFFVVHGGRRGVTCMLYHFGVWTDMPEVFHNSWYTYADSNEYDELDALEPIACFHDVDLVLAEIAQWKSCIVTHADVLNGSADWNAVYDGYFSGESRES